MPRWDGSGAGTAQASATDSVSDDLLNITSLARAIPQTPLELRAERKTRNQDFAFFAQFPERGSYVRKYREGELPEAILRTQRSTGRGPSHVAVAYVCPGERVRVYIWPGHDRKLACVHAEQQAEAERVKRGLAGTA